MSASVRISQGLQGISTKLSEKLDKVAGEHVGFTLLIYSGDRVNYVSNVTRKEGIEQLEVFLKTQKEGAVDIPYHKTH